MRCVLLALLGSVAVTGAAAADEPWDGFYLGVSGGYTEVESRFEDRDFDWFGSTHNWIYNGGTAGGQFGYNWQTRNSVFGLEADFMWTGADDDEIFAADNMVPQSVNWTSSLRARSGFGFGGVLFYNTLGLAFADFERSWTEFNDFEDSWPDLGDTKFGVTGGFGVEGIVGGGWSVRGEFLATRYDDNTAVNPLGFPLTIDDTTYTFRAGVNYLFGAGAREGFSIAEGNPFDFSGYYIGVSAGGHQATVQSTDIDYRDFRSTHDLLSEGFAGGVELGWNNQINGFVYGLEAGAMFFTGDKSLAGGTDRRSESGMNWSAEVRVKTGMAADNMLMYIFNGFAYGNYDLREVNLDGDVVSEIWPLSGSHPGFVTGAGIERAITPSLSLNVEAAWRAFSGDTVTAAQESDYAFRGAAQDLSLTAGLNYYFGERSEMGTGALPAGDWRGFFGGLDAIFAYHHGDMFDIDRESYGATYTVPSFGAGGGAHLGVNWQSNAFVYGLIGDFAFYTNEASDVSPELRSFESALNWMGTFRARAGLASGEALLYATAGAAFADVDLANRNLDIGPDRHYLLDGFRFGWTAGLGAEHQVDERSSLRFETLYTRFGEEETTNAAQSICSNGLTSNPCRVRGYDDNITVKLSYSYRFTRL